MGISGLLPALKSIQVKRHLSDYAGKTVAIDAYVWLHKGVYGCAAEIAMGKDTHKYVDFAMHRVRLLRHHKITPYLVFDGGPLPAKKGTENGRKQKREESLVLGRKLAAQGNHAQAREHFVKSIDVTPQMAYQLIKALKAEQISYIVAPYEADAQLAYLQKIGIADAILTEDSDLLVFDCADVLYKLDAVEQTVMSIKREHFGSVTANATDSNSISLVGWSNKQFRAMAILSGCDYLSNIPGIGLKTACNLLRKWKTPENVVRAIMMEGKKAVPPGYMEQFRKADKCFLHQRVWCPLSEDLVHLTSIEGEDWDNELDAFVGSYIDPVQAKAIALGEADPVTRAPMIDINPSFVPRVIKPKTADTLSHSPTMSARSKGKMREKVPSAGILSFFGPNPVIPPRNKHVTSTMNNVINPNIISAGKASGKRTLAEVMDCDVAVKKKHRKSLSPPQIDSTQPSKFFDHRPSAMGRRSASIPRRHSDGGIRKTTSFSGTREGDKENLFDLVEGEGNISAPEDGEASDLSLKVQCADVSMDLDTDIADERTVEQEDGYISPFDVEDCDDIQNLSSPVRPPKTLCDTAAGQHARDEEADIYVTEDEAEFAVDPISSPPTTRKLPPTLFQRRAVPCRTPARPRTVPEYTLGKVLVETTPDRDAGTLEGRSLTQPTSKFSGPDLRSCFLDEDGQETQLDFQTNIQCKPRGTALKPGLDGSSGSTSPPSPSPETPVNVDRYGHVTAEIIDADTLITAGYAGYTYVPDSDEDFELDNLEVYAKSCSTAISEAWKKRFAYTGSKKTSTLSATTAYAKKRVLSPATVNKSSSNIRNPSSPRKNKAFSTPTVTKGASSSSSLFNLQRSETNVTPAGRFSLANSVITTSAPPKLSRTASSKKRISLPGDVKSKKAIPQSLGRRSNPNFTNAHGIKTHARPTNTNDDSEVEDDAEGEEVVMLNVQQRLAQFRRCP